MTLLLVFALLTGGFTALFLGVSIVAQGYLYQEPAPRLPLRSVAGGLILGGFITLWTAIDKNNPGRFGPPQDFSPRRSVEFTEFEAVRWPAGADGKLKTDPSGKPVETVAKFKRTVGGKGSAFVEEGTSDPFKPTGSSGGLSYMTGAIRVKGPDDPEPVRYNAVVNDNPRTKQKEYPQGEREFREEKGERFVTFNQMGTIYIPSSGTLAVWLLLNVATLVLWLVVTWLILRYALAHALGLTAVGVLVTLFILNPLLFKFNKPPEPKPASGAPAPQAPSLPKGD